MNEKNKKELENEQRKQGQKTGANSKIIDFTNINIIVEVILGKIREILQKALYKVYIVVPKFSDLQELYLYEIRSDIDIKISCKIDLKNSDQIDILKEYNSLEKIEIRNFIGSERYVILRDGEELFAAFKGTKDLNYLTFHTSDATHIKLLSSIALGKKKSDDIGYFPYPYIFKPPAPPKDIAPAGQLQAKQINTEEKPEYELYCKYCGSKLVKNQKFCEKCGAKLLGKNEKK